MNYNLQGKTWEGASDLPQPRTAPSLTLVQKAGQRGRAHCAFGLASNNRNSFLTCKLKRELGTRVHIVRCDMTLAYLKTNAETAHKLSDMIASFVEYRETRAKLAQLEQKLEI